MNTLQDSLANISFMEKASFHYVMDKGFYSGPNIDAFYADPVLPVLCYGVFVIFGFDAPDRRFPDEEKFFVIGCIAAHHGQVKAGNE